MIRHALGASAILFAAGQMPAAATTITDAAADYLPTYTGPQNADLDIRYGRVRYDSLGVYVEARMGATPGSQSPAGLVLWGVDRGSGFSGFSIFGPPAVGSPAQLLDAVIVTNYNGTGRVRTFASPFSFVDTALPAGSVSIDGTIISTFVPFSMLQSTGFATMDYTYGLFSRSQLGPQSLIADIAPDTAAGLTASAVPEPLSWAMMITGFGIVGAAARRRRIAAYA